MNNQKDYTISEFFTLPSEGKVYHELIEPQVELRSMTTAEEMRRLSPTDHPYENLCSIIDDCLVRGPKISSYDMCLGDYQFLLYKLRIVTYGPEYTVQSTCPYCKTFQTSKINLEDLVTKSYTEDIEKYFVVDLPISKKQIKLKMTTPRMLDNIQLKLKDFKRKHNDSALNASIIYSISSVIDTVDGRKVNEAKLEEFVRSLPMKDTNTIANYSDKLNSMIGIDNRLTLICDMCGLEHPGNLTITNEFFRPALDI